MELQQVGQCIAETLLVHEWATSIHGPTKLTMDRTLGKPSLSPLQYSLWLAMGATPKCHFVLKFLKLELPPLWKPIISYVDLWLRWGLKKIYSLCWKLFNDMWHTNCTHVIQGDSKILVVGNQIDILISNPSFSHNLFCKYSNGSCEFIFKIYVLKYFQWYKEILNLMSFDLSNCFMKIQDPQRFQFSKWNVWVHSFTLSCTIGNVNVTPKLHS